VTRRRSGSAGARRIAAAVLSAAVVLAGAPTADASFAVGVGAGSLQLPDNSGPFADAAPQGESKGSAILFWSGTANATLGFGASYSGYRLDKQFVDTTGTIDTRWSVTELSAHLELRKALGGSPSSPSVAARFGLAIVPIKVEASTPDSLDYDSNDEIRVGPYLGLDFRVPFGQSRFAAFAATAKSFVKSTLLREDMNVGSWMIGAGLAYLFRGPHE
jgi:hypothetical protein